jgi:hypothetical protein
MWLALVGGSATNGDAPTLSASLGGASFRLSSVFCRRWVPNDMVSATGALDRLDAVTRDAAPCLRLAEHV